MSAFNNLRRFFNSTEMDNIKVSVTVPVYNTAKYLRQCLDSLKAQTLKNIEFILVNDGSTDISGEICEEYAKKDSRFRVIHQKNGGLATARQTGLDNAHGEYVIVCDSDDWTEPDIYEKLYQKAKETNADIVLCGYYAEYGDGRSVPNQTVFKEKNGFVNNGDLIRRGAGSSWVKLIRKLLFEKTQSNYELGINLSEDALILYKLMSGNPNVVQIIEPLYHYRRLFGEQTYTNSICMSHIRQLRYTYNWLKINYTDSEYQDVIENRAVDLAFACIRANDIDTVYVKKFLSSEVPYRVLFSHPNRLKGLIVAIEKLFPLSIPKTILRLAYKRYYK